MKARYSYEVMPQDVDGSRQIRLYALENYLLNVAGRDADASGFGIRQLLPYGYTWIITRLNLELTCLPTHNEILDIETWVEQNAHMLSLRNFRIYRGGTLIGQAKSVWAVLDLKKREIVQAFDLPVFGPSSVDGEILSLSKPMRIGNMTAPNGIVRHTIRYSDIDYNGHCNSCKYLEIMLNAKMPDVHNFPIRLDINYMKEVHLNDVIETHFLEDSQGIQYQQKDISGTTCCSARIARIEQLSC